MGGKRQLAREQRLARIRLLSSELDNIRLSSLERTRSIDTKASFVVVAAGVIAAAAFDSLNNSDIGLFAIFPVALTVATVVVAAVALWPAKLESASGRDVVNEWVDAAMTPDDLEDSLLEVKVVEIEFRDARNESKGLATKWAFGLLVSSLVTALITAGIGAAISNGDPTDGETINTPSPTTSKAP